MKTNLTVSSCHNLRAQEYLFSNQGKGSKEKMKIEIEIEKIRQCITNSPV